MLAASGLSEDYHRAMDELEKSRSEMYSDLATEFMEESLTQVRLVEPDSLKKVHPELPTRVLNYMKAVELFVTFTKMGDREFGIKSDELMDVCFDWWNASSRTFNFPPGWPWPRR